jgi:PDZ domain-containing protein
MYKKYSKHFAVFLIVLFLLLASFYSLPYYVTKPGMAKELDPIVDVENGYKGKGDFMLTTVRMGKANIYTYLLASLSKYQEIYPLDAVRDQEETDEEYNVRQLNLMSNSKLAAIEVAYREAGIPYKYHYKGVYVLNVVEGMPADGKLSPGDRIFKVDGTEFDSSAEFTEFVRKKKAGDSIALTYERENKVKTVTMKVRPFAENKNKIGVGIGLVDDKEIEVQPSVTVETDDIGGPSAGFMFSLEIYNQLTEEDLTRGYHIAGTGTMSPDGQIGRIGGIEQKIIAADKADADFFFAPNENGADNSNYKAAVKTAKDIGTGMKIIPVDTFEEAVAYLEKLKPKKE